MIKIQFLTLLSGLVFILLACGQTAPEVQNSKEDRTMDSPRDCIKRIIARDDFLGEKRNHDCETISLELTILNYVEGLKNLSFEGCPEGFIEAFGKHRQAWMDMVPFVKQYPDLRGEMHELFDQLEKGDQGDTFKPLLKAIWDTWKDIEIVMKTYEALLSE